MKRPADSVVHQKTVLDGGVRVVTEEMPHVRSLAIGFWFNTGSRDEPGELAGISHFLEHMNFKGTARRSAAAIARQIEGRGGHLNAFTAKEVTCFHARVIDTQLARAVNVLADITQNSLYNPNEVDRERGVILEELKNLEDTPDELVFEHFIFQIFAGHSMGRSVLGSRDTLAGIDRQKLLDYRYGCYDGSRTVVAAAGMVSHDRLVELVKRHFVIRAVAETERPSPSTPDVGQHRRDLHTNTQQAHICWGCRGYRYDDARKYALLVLNTILGGGMSSRLFQRIRERHGLAYSIFSFIETYLDSGIFGVYVGAEPSRAEKALRLVRDVAGDLTVRPVSASELQRTKDNLKGNLMLGLESPSSRMHRLAKMELYLGKWHSLDDVIANIDAVTAGDVRETARELFENQAVFTTILWPN